MSMRCRTPCSQLATPSKLPLTMDCSSCKASAYLRASTAVQGRANRTATPTAFSSHTRQHPAAHTLPSLPLPTPL